MFFLPCQISAADNCLRIIKSICIPGERTVYRVMEEIGLIHRPKHKPNGITKAHREARESDDLLKRDFTSTEPLKNVLQI